jgi:hypothetical protein
MKRRSLFQNGFALVGVGLSTLVPTGSKSEVGPGAPVTRRLLTFASREAMISETGLAAGDRCSTPSGLFEITGDTRATPNGATVLKLSQPGLQAFLLSGEPVTDLSALIADTRPASWFSPGHVIRTSDGLLYETAAGDATDYDVATAGGARLVTLGTEIKTDNFISSSAARDADMSATLTKAMARAAELSIPFRLSGTPKPVSETVTLPANLLFEGQSGSNYANPDRRSGGKIVNSKTTSGAVVSIAGTRLKSQGGHVRGLWLTSSGTDSGRADLSGLDLYGIEASNLFNQIFEDLVVDHFNGTWAFYTSKLCNKLVLVRPRILIVGSLAAASPSERYGGGLYLVAAPDSEVIEPFIEAVSGPGVYLGPNSKLRDGFVDLCEKGILIANGENTSVSGTSAKFHEKNAIQIINGVNTLITGNKLVSGNTGGAAWNSSDAAIISLGDEVKGARFERNDFRHLQQWRGPRLPPVINLGNGSNTAEMTNCILGDVVVGGSHIVDSNDVWAGGGFSFHDNTLDLGTGRAKLRLPVAFRPGLLIRNDRFTVTRAGQTFVVRGKGARFPWITQGWNPGQWTPLEDRDMRGLVVPAGVKDNIGLLRVSVHDGARDDYALTLSDNCNIGGVVQTRGLSRLVQAGGGSLGPAFQCDARPDSIATVTPGSGSVSLRGFSWPVTTSLSKTDGKGLMSLMPATSDTRFQGQVLVTGRQPANGQSFTASATVIWDSMSLRVQGSSMKRTGPDINPTARFVEANNDLCLNFDSRIPMRIEGQFAFDGFWTLSS